jgi:cytochrome c553
MLQNRLIASLICLLHWQALAAAPAPEALSPGLVATFQDDGLTVGEVAMLPELGLAAAESPHPAIKPAFSVRYEGFLEIAQAGRYEFETIGTLSINGEEATGEQALSAGKHPLILTYHRPAGEVRFGLSWKSGHFVEEPVPPAVLWHLPGTVPTAAVAGEYPAPSHRIRQAVVAMNCASCHDKTFLATMHHKFEPDSLLTLMRHANVPKWYGAMTGPLLADQESLAQLAVDLAKLPRGSRRRDVVAADHASAKTMVGTRNGLACIACHDIKHHKTEAESKGPNLALITGRVSYDWFVRWMENPGRMKPGVPMPAFFASQEPAERQRNIDALWDYLSQGQKMELPDELRVDPQQFILNPSGRPVYTRSYMRLPDGRELLRAICVGLPNGVSYCFDAGTCRLAYVWTGGFLDMAPHWQNQSGMPTPAIGEAFHLPAAEEGLRIGDHRAVFRGYDIIDGIPRFEFTLGESLVRLRIDAPTSDSLRQVFEISQSVDPVTYLGPSPESSVAMKSSIGDWVANRLTLAAGKDLGFNLTMEKKK